MSAAAGEKPEEVHPEKSQNKETETQASDAVKQEVKASNDANNTNQFLVKSESTDPSAPKAGEGDAPKEQDKATDGKPQEPEQNAAEKPKEEPTEEDLKTMPVRQYLETTVVGIVMQGMQQIVRKRPDDPIEWLADFLHRNNPKKRKADEPAPVPIQVDN